MHDMIDIIDTYILFQVEITVRWNICMYAYLMYIHNAIPQNEGRIRSSLFYKLTR